MSFHYTSYALFPLISAIILAALAALAWRRRDTPAAGPFAALMLAACGCKLAYALGMLSGPLGAKVLWTKVEYLGAAMVPLAWAAFALAYAGLAGGEKLRRVPGLLAVVPLCTVVFVWSNGLHGLVWTSAMVDRAGPFAALELARGPWYWVHAAYSYALITLGTFLLVFKIVRSSRPYHSQGLALLAGVLVSWGANALHLLGFEPVPHLNPGVIAFPLTGILFALALFRFRFLELYPVARATAFEGVRNGLIVTDATGRIVDLNHAAVGILGRVPGQVLGRDVYNVLRTDAGLDGGTLGRGVALGGGASDGAARRYDLDLAPLEEGGRYSGRLLSLTDVTETRRAEEALRESEERFRAVFEGAAIGMALADADGVLVRVNASLARMLGYEEGELRGRPFSGFTHPGDREAEARMYRGLVEGRRRRYQMEQRLLRKDGSEMWARLSASAITDKDKWLAVGTVEDMTERKAFEEELAHRAFHDSLTDLPNRSLFVDRLEHALERAARSAGDVAVLFLDLDGFKRVNDSFGHATGDQLLEETARRLRACVRPGDTVARLGGDEFAILLEDVGLAEVGETVMRIEKEVSFPFIVDEAGSEISVTASVGVAAAGAHGFDPTALVRAADRSMYGSKRGGERGPRPA